ncbi:hypothetical protein OKW41_007088 [Paraburkholderia sp. UCT70]
MRCEPKSMESPARKSDLVTAQHSTAMLKNIRAPERLTGQHIVNILGIYRIGHLT